MTKAVLEAESEGEARQTVAAVPSPALTVPASLHASEREAQTRSPAQNPYARALRTAKRQSLKLQSTSVNPASRIQAS